MYTYSVQLSLCNSCASKRFIIPFNCTPDKLPDAIVYSLAGIVYRVVTLIWKKFNGEYKPPDAPIYNIYIILYHVICDVTMPQYPIVVDHGFGPFLETCV